MSTKAERNGEIVRRYLAGEQSKALGDEFGLKDNTILYIVRRSSAPIEQRISMTQANMAAGSVRGLKTAMAAIKGRQRENARNRQIESWLSEGLSYTEAAFRASTMFWETSRCAVAGIANRQRKREAANHV